MFWVSYTEKFFMIVLFVHGWSVTTTDTYGALPEALIDLAAGRDLEIETREIFLGRYISFNDEVEVDDVARAFQQAMQDTVSDALAAGTPIACITHSTGGPVVRVWLDRFFGTLSLEACPIKWLIMLAPANHGSALAVLGKKRVGRIKSFFSGVEPGERILHWLELGSAGQWTLSDATLGYAIPAAGFYPFVITGQTVDAAWYDHLNSYTGERGGDGVVRVAGANMNYSMYELVQGDEPIASDENNATALTLRGRGRGSPEFGLAILPDTSHSGDEIGIMQSVTRENAASRAVVAEILECLGVDSTAAYATRVAVMTALSETTQQNDADNRDPDDEPSKYSMLIFRIRDDQGRPIEDFDLFMLAGPGYPKTGLPRGFFMDRQRNTVSTNTITYFVNAGILTKAQDGAFGLQVVARPRDGFTYYHPAVWHSTDQGVSVTDVVKPNETAYIDIIMKRRIDRNTMVLGPSNEPRDSFKETRPSGSEITT
jgi:hypothetical protein